MATAVRRGLCHNLRTKKSYVPAYGGQDLYGPEQMNAQYFCLRTLLQVGLDDGPVGPEACGPHRRCFEGLAPLV